MRDIIAPTKLIETALPLEDINREAAREKSIRHGHPSTLHLWWARRPLAAARAVLFAQLVNDPGGARGWKTGVTRQQADDERKRLFAILRDLVKWENSNDPRVLAAARAEIVKSWRETCALNKGLPGFDPDRLPALHDPFAGGGAIPLEGQRLGLEAFASDLNPVAVTINKAMIEIPPKFAGRRPVGPVPDGESESTVAPSGAEGLAEDVRRYGVWMRARAREKIGAFYPSVRVTAEMVRARPDLAGHLGKDLTPIAWLWARTVPSPDPRFRGAPTPLVSSFVLSKKGDASAYVVPSVTGDQFTFTVKIGTPPKEAETGTKLARGAKFRCLLSETVLTTDYIREQCQSGKMGSRLMAIVCEGAKGRVYLSPTDEHENLTQQIKIENSPPPHAHFCRKIRVGFRLRPTA